MKIKKVFLYSCFIIGLISMTSGIFLTICSFKHEVLDKKYIIEKYSAFTSKEKTLKKGQVDVRKDVLYTSKGIYKIVYTFNHNQEDENILFADKSHVTITDIIGDGYELDTNRVIINNDRIKLYNYNTTTSDYSISYNNNTFEISFPKDRFFKYKKIIFYIKLKDRDINKKYVTSKESYYSFTPSLSNDYYEKKTIQSYVIDGSGYIVLKNK